MDAFNKSKTFRGSYMTDLFKHSTAVRQNDLIISEKNKDKAYKDFSTELKAIGARNPRIIVFGDKAHKDVLDWQKTLDWQKARKFKCRIEKIPHFSYWERSKFINAARGLK